MKQICQLEAHPTPPRQTSARNTINSEMVADKRDGLEAKLDARCL